jgi:hypothetical protein
MQLSKIRTNLTVDDPLVQDADYRFDELDRAYIDEQVRACETHLAALLLNGVHATWLWLDAASAALSPGDCVCLSSSPASVATVTTATPAALAQAGSVLGVALLAAPPGARTMIALRGALAPTLTGLSQTGPMFVRCGVTARAERVAKFTAADFPLGSAPQTGFLHLAPLVQVASLLP